MANVRLSRKLERLVGERSLGCATQVPKLSRRDISKLQEILEQRPAADSGTRRKQVLVTLAAAAPADATAQSLGKVLAAKRESLNVRVSAASNLGLHTDAVAERILLKHIKEPQPELRMAVIDALARIGGPRSARALAQLKLPKNPAEKRRLDLARRLIAAREGSAERPPRSETGWRSQSVQILQGKEAAALSADLWGSRWGIQISRELALVTDCANCETVVLFNAELSQSNMARLLQEKPMLVGLLTQRGGIGRELVVSTLVVARPKRGGVSLEGFLTSGEQVLEGEAFATADGIRFSVSDVGPMRGSIRADGEMGAEGLKLQLRSWRGPELPKQHGHEASGS
jgi:HEAT repeats